MNSNNVINAGDLDASFGSDGIAELRLTDYQGQGFYNALIDNENLYAVGFAHRSFTVACFSLDGVLKEAFGNNGCTEGDFLQEANSAGRYITVTNDNKLILAGTAKTKEQYIGFARINAADGLLDTSFSEDGVVVHNLFSAQKNVNDLSGHPENRFAFSSGRSPGIGAGKGIILPDEKLIFALNGTGIGPSGHSVIARFQKSPDKLDIWFGNKGFVEVSHPDYKGGITQLMNITVQTDLKYVACGFVLDESSSAKGIFVRYNEDGTPDTSFGLDGYAVIEPLPSEPQESVRLLSVVQQSNGNLVAVGIVGFASYGILVNVDKSGNLNRAFNKGRPVYFKVGSQETGFESVAVQSDGNIVVAGWSGENASTRKLHMVIARYLESGRIDPAYGANQLGYVQPDSRPTVGFGVVVQEDDKAVVLGQLLDSPTDSSVIWRLSC